MTSFKLDKNQQYINIQSDVLSLIRENFSVSNPAYGKFKFNKFIPKRIYNITPTGKTDLGMYGEIISFLTKEDLIFNLNPDIDILYKPKFNNYKLPTLKFELRSYQKSAVQQCLTNGRGVIILPTAAGKTLTIASLIEAIHSFHISYRVLIIVPNIQLINQTYTDFIEYGINSEKLSKWSGDNTPNLHKSIVIAGAQILQSQYEENKEYLQSINLLIIDECHKIRKGNVINKILKYIVTPNKFGFTGTMPPDIIDQWNIIGKIGPVLYEEKSYNLRDSNQIANVNIQILTFNYFKIPTLSKTKFNPAADYEEEVNFIINSNERNTKLAQICNNTDKNTLIMVERILHGEILLKKIKEVCKSKEVFFIQGSVDVEVREEMRKIMEQKNNVICIAISKVFAEGINIKNLHYIIFAAARKAKIKILQSIGRGLRLHPDKKTLIVIDIADNLKYANKHLKERLKLYDTEKIQYKTTEIQC